MNASAALNVIDGDVVNHMKKMRAYSHTFNGTYKHVIEISE